MLCACFLLTLFFTCSGDHRDLHSFPTRSSSDLTLRDPLCEESPVARRQLRIWAVGPLGTRSEEHTSELQSPMYLVCRLLLEKKKKKIKQQKSRTREKKLAESQRLYMTTLGVS